MLPDTAQDQAPARVEVVIDTNVLLDWLVFGDRAVAGLVHALESGRSRWVATPAMLDELDEVMVRLGRQPEPGFTPVGRSHCLVVASPPQSGGIAIRCRDPDDQMFIDLAISRRARFVFTRDKALLELTRAAAGFGVRVCRPDQVDWPAEEQRAA